MVETLNVEDYASITVYFVLVLIVGMWASFRKDKGSATGYFLAGKTMSWFPIGASIYASNVGAPMFIGLAGTSSAGGLAYTIYEWHALPLLILLGWCFLPVYVASGTFTMPDYLKKRFGGRRLQISLSILSIAMYMVGRISTELFSGALFLQQMLGWNMYACVLIILAVTTIYTTAGGLAAVIYTDTLQSFILIIGAFILFVIGIADLDGWNSFVSQYANAASKLTLSDPVNYSCGMPRSDAMHMWRDAVTADIPWTGSVFGLTVLGFVCWVADQITVQRCLAGKDMSHSKAGAIFGGILKMTSFILFVIPGMMSRIFFPDEVACSDPEMCYDVCGNRAGCSNIAYPLLVLRKLPAGLRGIMLAALFAAIMSSLTSIFNSASSIITMDIWRRFRRRASTAELMIVGRLSIVILVGCSILWLPIIQETDGGQMWTYFQSVAACMTPPWCWLFVLGVFWKRTTEQGAFWGLVASACAGFIRLVLEFSYSAPYCGSFEPDLRPAVLSKVHFLHFAIISSLVSIITTVVVSMLTKPRPRKKLRRVTWWTRHDPLEPELTESEDEGDDEKKERYDSDEESIGEGPCSGRLKDRPALRTVYQWWCGVSDQDQVQMSPEEKQKLRARMTDIGENPRAKKITEVAAVLSAALFVFLIAFFY